MSLAAQIALALLAALPLFLASTVFFDVVHWVLHALLRARSPFLRVLAWPHGIHHRWLDRQLAVRPEHQRANVFCHIVPEYLTHLAFSAALLAVLPAAAVAGAVALQTWVFLMILKERGLDLNHRPVPILDAYRPMFFCPPAYHALHHVHPDAHFSSYLKFVDYAVGGGAELRGRRVALLGTETPFAAALREELARAGAELHGAEAPLRELDVLVLCDADAPLREPLEQLCEATRGRQLPPEVWALRRDPADAVARHYYRDVRVGFRALLWSEAVGASPRRAARRALFFVRRGFHFVPTAPGLAAAWRAWRRFRATRPDRPAGVPRVRSRAELARAAGGAALPAGAAAGP